MPEPIANAPPFGDITSILDLIKQFTGTKTTTDGESTTTNELSDPSAALMSQLLGNLLPQINSDKYSPEAATRDAQGLVDNIMKQFTEQQLPQIYQSQANSGGYNSTTAQLMANDQQARAAAAAAAQVTATKESYAKIQQGTMSQLVNVLLGLIAATKKTTTQNNNKQTTGQPGSGSPLSNLAKGALGAAAANAAKNLIKPDGGKPGKTKPPPKTPDQQQDPDKQTTDEKAVEDAINNATTNDPNAPHGPDTNDPNYGENLANEILSNIDQNNSSNNNNIDQGNGPAFPGPDGSSFPSGGNETDGLNLDNPFSGTQDFFNQDTNQDVTDDSQDDPANLLDALFGPDPSGGDPGVDPGSEPPIDDGSDTFDFGDDSSSQDGFSFDDTFDFGDDFGS